MGSSFVQKRKSIFYCQLELNNNYRYFLILDIKKKLICLFVLH